VGNDVVVVPAKGTDRATNFATEAGAWYVVTVAGTYSYNGRATGLADCGHYVPEGSKTWGRYEALWVDGAPAPCLTMPVDPVHTYQWRLRGTGRNVTFRVNDYGGGGDNLGDLVVSLRRADPPVP
jgi:hypothetical protein